MYSTRNRRGIAAALGLEAMVLRQEVLRASEDSRGLVVAARWEGAGDRRSAIGGRRALGCLEAIDDQSDVPLAVVDSDDDAILGKSHWASQARPDYSAEEPAA